ncbi:hypothetical protein M409DRAFT_18158 [Zasmidium cellare ATCC 36951]|uniref:Protein-lysine N-methyltransferase EFM4 n=1 Tax=Zasmidium cellare ATCC 36951 TaxID=1080233 RepID=A0A6A6CXI8_ZASCE|nr:uncharacterized protein M409DRAFT_18158 [Zasmidium cellare ATCC 36951]KAF2171927.1 hypothetical protein M409DRAFT_18158 [Zasmidium cellare ATCC 36951]
MDTTSTSPPHQEGRKLLDPSELGTKEYWEAAYTRELHNNTEDADDEGIIWFDESNAEDTVLKKLASYVESEESDGRGILVPNQTSFLDLGTGNGHMLFALREDEDEDGEVRWPGARLVGVDYSPKSVELARQLDVQRRGDDEATEILFEQWDLLGEEPGDWLDGGFDVLLDKGTFDAISLMPHDGASPHPCEVYREKVVPLIKPGRFLLITSCNWTKDELVSWLAPKGGALELFDEAKYPTFTFGGQTGQSVVTLVFCRNA